MARKRHSVEDVPPRSLRIATGQSASLADPGIQVTFCRFRRQNAQRAMSLPEDQVAFWSHSSRDCLTAHRQALQQRYAVYSVLQLLQIGQDAELGTRKPQDLCHQAQLSGCEDAHNPVADGTSTHCDHRTIL